MSAPISPFVRWLPRWLLIQSQRLAEMRVRFFGWMLLSSTANPRAQAGKAASRLVDFTLPAPQATQPVAPQLPLHAYASVVIPALNEAARIAQVVAYALADPATAEVIVIDDSSIDDTVRLARHAGARVVTSTMLGKGASMHDGVGLAAHDILVYLDGDLAGLRKGIITDLCMPILGNRADCVKARFGRAGGRVTELTAKPMLKIFFPELAHFRQPLGGIMAARKSLLQTLSFEDGYGVDVGLLLDAHLARARIAEVDIGSLDHESQPLQDLAFMANEVSRVIFSRARLAGRLHVDQIAAMYETQRLAASEIDYVLTRRKGRQRLLLLGIGATITPSCFELELAKVCGQEAALQRLMAFDGDEDAAGECEGDIDGDEEGFSRCERIASLFRFVPRQQFERVARTMAIRPEVIGLVNQLRRYGFMVGIVSDGYFVAADIIRRRIFADFAMAHTIQFDGEVCTGQIRTNPAFLPELPESRDGVRVICKSNVLRRFLTDTARPAIQTTWVLGDCASDLGLMRLADRAFAVATRSQALLDEPGVTHVDSATALLALLPNHELVPDQALVPG